MLSKSLIPFSVDGWSCVPSLVFTWDQTMAEVMKIMEAFFKRSHECTATLTAPNPQLRWRLLNTPGQVWVSLMWSHCSFLLGPGHTRFSLWPPPPRVYFPGLYKFWQLYGGLMVTSSKRAYVISKSDATRDPVPVAVHC